MARKLDTVAVGCWVVKANPAVSDWVAQIEADGACRGRRRATTWTVRDSYRADRMAAGDLVALWVTGNRQPGIHEVGRLTSAAAPPTASGQQRLISYDAVAFADPVPRAELVADPVLAGCEQLRIPLVGTPTYFTTAETRALGALLAGRLKRSAARSVGWRELVARP